MELVVVTNSANNPLMLTKSELVELTEYARPKQQKSRLDELGIPYIIGRTGSPRVFRVALENLMIPGKAKMRRIEPDFSALLER